MSKTTKTDKNAAKFVLLGQAAVGKSSVVLRFVEGKFRDYFESTSGASYFNKKMSLRDGTVLQLSIWDTAGQERFRSLAKMYYRDANAALVVFDLLDYESFKIAKQWVKDLQRECTKNCIIALAGNKIDSVEEGKVRQIPLSEVSTYCQENSLIYFDVSAKTGKNVDAIFQALAERYQQEKDLQSKDEGTSNLVVINGGQQTTQPSGGGCPC